MAKDRFLGFTVTIGFFAQGCDNLSCVLYVDDGEVADVEKHATREILAKPFRN